MEFARRIAAISLTCLCYAAPAFAHPAGPTAPYTLSVQDERGHQLPTFHHGGQTFVLGTYGERYTIRVENRTARRVEAVVSVDGRDVISGQIGDYVHERGYLIDPYGELVIEGFRQSWQDVAAFRFTSPGASYSARMGTPQNVGVIGVAIFPERTYQAVARPKIAPRARRPVQPDDYGLGLGTGGRSEASRAPSANADEPQHKSSERREAEGASAAMPAPQASTDNLGTEYGESVASSVQAVEFRRANASHPAALITLRYDDREGLIARGVALDPPRPRRRCGPEAFPHSGFAPPPPPYCD
jgi:hypothetical protein